MTASSQLAVLAFTDVVGSTDLKARLGDAAAAELLRKHNELVRQALAGAGGGRILKDTGDGFLLQFSTPSEAVRFGLLLQHAVSRAKWGGNSVAVRVGVHVGEVSHADAEPDGTPKILGLAVDTAARVTSLARPGQSLLTAHAFESARHGVRQHPAVNDEAVPEIRWISHGPYQLQGVMDPIEICEVGAVGIAPLTAPPDGDKARRVFARAMSPELPIAHATPRPARRSGLRILIVAVALVIVGGGVLVLFAGLFMVRVNYGPAPKTAQQSVPAVRTSTQGAMSAESKPTSQP
jgi:class 3 adenylate cyclase